MNRRKFFSSISSAVVGVYLGCHVKPLTETTKFVAVTNINPAWEDAPYELAFVYATPGYNGLKWRRAAFPENMGDTIRFIRE